MQINTDGSYILEVPYGKDTELIMDIMKQGPDVEVLAPNALRNRVSESVSATNSLYQTSN